MTVRQRNFFLLLLAAGLALRVSLALWMSPGPTMGFLDDDGDYVAIARNLHERGAYEMRGFQAFRPPLFPLFLAGVFSLHGVEAWVMPARLWIALFSLLAPLAAWWLARRWWGETAALGAFAWAMFHPHFLHYAFRVQNDSFFLPFAAWGAALLCAPPSAAAAALGGAATGLAVLGKSQFIGAAAVGFAWLLLPSPDRRRRWAFLFLAAFLAVMTPWWLRNFRVFHRFVPFSTEGGYTLWVGNNPLADGGGTSPASPAPAGLDELAWDRWHRREALSYIVENPGRTAALAVEKLSRLWALTPQIGGTGTKLASLAAFLPLFLLPLWVLYAAPLEKRRWCLPVLGLCAYYSVIGLFFPAVMRYRLPLEALFIAWGAGAWPLWMERRGKA